MSWKIKFVLSLVIVYFFAIVFLSDNRVFAQSVDSETVSATESAKINSFELFWPIVPGKTMNESFYFLKDFKENLRAMFIFGSAQRADYEVMLSVKRILEAEKLYSQNNTDLGNKTLDMAIKRLDLAEKSCAEVNESKKPYGDSGVSMLNRLSNLEVYLGTKVDDEHYDKDKLNSIVTKIESIKEKLK